MNWVTTNNKQANFFVICVKTLKINPMIQWTQKLAEVVTGLADVF